MSLADDDLAGTPPPLKLVDDTFVNANTGDVIELHGMSWVGNPTPLHSCINAQDLQCLHAAGFSVNASSF